MWPTLILKLVSVCLNPTSHSSQSQLSCMPVSGRQCCLSQPMSPYDLVPWLDPDMPCSILHLKCLVTSSLLCLQVQWPGVWKTPVVISALSNMPSATPTPLLFKTPYPVQSVAFPPRAGVVCPSQVSLPSPPSQNILRKKR